MSSTFHFNHSQLGDLVGLPRGNDVVQFRGIPFASIPARFRQSVMVHGLPLQPFDATQSGPICPQTDLVGPPFWDGALPQDYPVLYSPKMCELNCLNLTITAPTSALEAHNQAKVPVLIFIHGGAFIGGSQCVTIAGREVFDATNLVRASLARKQSIVVVTINYRLGPLGFMASQELEAFNRYHGEPVGNYGFHDQARGLDWVNKFIGAFGGDPGQVTLHGTSAGGCSTHYHTVKPNRRFRRAILSSGTLTGISPKSMAEHQVIFQGVVDNLRKVASTPAPALELVQSVPVHDLIASITPEIYNPLSDDDWRNNSADGFGDHAPLELMVGACEFEQEVAEVLLSDIKNNKELFGDKLLNKVRGLCTANEMLHNQQGFPLQYHEVLKAYNIGVATSFTNWAALAADVMFRLPPMYLASRYPNTKMFIYEIAARNPFPNWKPSYGKANHGINDILLFNVAEDLVPAEHLSDWQGSVEQIQSAWLDFCYGLDPWAHFKTTENGDPGPFYKFRNGKDGQLCHSLEELLGQETAKRFKAILEVLKSDSDT
ncbi:hypothetical protein ASPVEDRAFT_32735 [Aspergillus versicolor CBS 583.65]|uniref:Carboxylic ester hydrolase n=1 Tax=Aspergillus versicolor CBS 583.65 TaxID=1036611 RepID=A0A1L9PYC6_ASPVE|nr:uncharacterized protein ASPVEDRAFT_32735 [Aspergillus versicolor CBS 583.65]OJJ06436.1 hypothetical protein ASPVEDRAFT_32735 [Aspergillus versicolor CBS 583.65]